MPVKKCAVREGRGDSALRRINHTAASTNVRPMMTSHLAAEDDEETGVRRQQERTAGRGKAAHEPIENQEHQQYNGYAIERMVQTKRQEAYAEQGVKGDTQIGPSRSRVDPPRDHGKAIMVVQHVVGQIQRWAIDLGRIEDLDDVRVDENFVHVQPRQVHLHHGQGEEHECQHECGRAAPAGGRSLCSVIWRSPTFLTRKPFMARAIRGERRPGIRPVSRRGTCLSSGEQDD